MANQNNHLIYGVVAMIFISILLSVFWAFLQLCATFTIQKYMYVQIDSFLPVFLPLIVLIMFWFFMLLFIAMLSTTLSFRWGSRFYKSPLPGFITGFTFGIAIPFFGSLVDMITLSPSFAGTYYQYYDYVSRDPVGFLLYTYQKHPVPTVLYALIAAVLVALVGMAYRIYVLKPGDGEESLKKARNTGWQDILSVLLMMVVILVFPLIFVIPLHSF